MYARRLAFRCGGVVGRPFSAAAAACQCGFRASSLWRCSSTGRRPASSPPGLRRRRRPLAAAAQDGGAATPSNADTIYALATGAASAGRAGVAMVRVSGPQALTCVQQLSADAPSPPAPRRASLRRLYHPHSRELLDQALVLFFPAPNSFTGEDVAELHLHGSYSVVVAVLQALSEVTPAAAAAGRGRVRPAERGEFTRRAFDNGRMDLTEVEGLADLIAAESSEQRHQALRQMGGEMRRVYERWREELMQCLAYAEAVIDFGEDVDESALEDVVPRVRRLQAQMKRALDDRRRGEIVRSGVRMAILGPPNAGKSSLLNALAKKPTAIVSPIAGTTRDVVQVTMDLAGLSVLISDTAGIRENTDDPIELEGIRRAYDARQEANLVVYVVDASDASDSVSWLASQSQSSSDARGCSLYVANKVDLCAPAEVERLAANAARRLLGVSCKTGEGLNTLVEALEAQLRRSFAVEGGNGGDSDASTSTLVTRERHRVHLQACAEALRSFLTGCEACGGDLPLDIATEELRVATVELGQIVGVVDVEEVLDIVFRDFCVGK